MLTWNRRSLTRGKEESKSPKQAASLLLTGLERVELQIQGRRRSWRVSFASRLLRDRVCNFLLASTKRIAILRARQLSYVAGAKANSADALPTRLLLQGRGRVCLSQRYTLSRSFQPRLDSLEFLQECSERLERCPMCPEPMEPIELVTESRLDSVNCQGRTETTSLAEVFL